MTGARPPLARGRLDRDGQGRLDPARVSDAWRNPDAVVVRLRGVTFPVLRAPDGSRRISFVFASDLRVPANELEANGVYYLGRLDHRPIFGAALTDGDDSGVRIHYESVPPGAPDEEWVHPFAAAMDLDHDERELVTVTAALARWHESAGFSSRDGTATAPAQGGWARIDAHGGEHFPRTDPAVIVLVEHDDRVLLGSNVLWEQGRFSILAGFVEAGESLEQAVAREVFEESGMRLGEIRYVTSQPWPFPRSLMLGFRARLAPGVDPDALVPDPDEISELRWFTRHEIQNPGPEIKLPQHVSIARWLLDQWVQEGDSARD